MAAELGQSADPRALVPGDPAAMRAGAEDLLRRARDVEEIGDALRRLDTGGWTGRSAEAFRRAHTSEVPRWYAACDSLSVAAQSLADHAAVVRGAQQRASEAARLWEAGQTATRAAQEAHDRTAAADPVVGPAPVTPFVDPGAAQRAEAVALLREARRAVENSARAGAAALGAEGDLAPQDSRLQGVSNFLGGIGTSLREAGEGVVATATDPVASVAAMGAAVADPVGTLKETVAYDDFAHGRADRGIGRLVGDVGLTVLTGGAAKAAKLARVPDGPVPDRPASAHAPADPRSPGPAATTHPSAEPVDLGSGLLFQSEVDVELPGLLPLVLARTHVSGYRAGRFFGPSWASTLDQHLQVGEDTVWFARDDAHVLAFPHPGPRAVASTHSARWTLAPGELDGVGTLVVADHDARRRLHFEGTGAIRRLAAITDGAGHRLAVGYAADGAPAEVVATGGRTVVVRTLEGRVAELALRGAGASGGDLVLRHFRYTDRHLTAIVDSAGRPFRYAYDDRGRVTGWIDRNGAWYRHEYDEHDRVVRQVGADGALSASYVHDGAETRMTDALGHVWRYVHDEAHRVVLAVDPLGGTTRQEWGDDGRLVARTDELGYTVRVDLDGAVERHRAADGTATLVERDPRGLPLRVTGPDGGVEVCEYDAAGRPTARTDPAGARTEYRYDARGHLHTVVDAHGGRTVVETDAAGLPVAVTDPLGATTRWERDAAGRVVAEIDALGGRTGYRWTPEGLPAAVVTPDGRVAQVVHDGEGSVVATIDESGHVTRVERTHFDVPAARVDPDGARHEYRWDAAMRLVEVVDPQGLRWRYEYDPCGRVVAETDFDGHRRTYELDAAGRVVARRDASGRVVAYRRDAGGAVVERVADGEVTTFERDAAGRLVRARTTEVDLVVERDALGRVVSESVDGRALTSVYDELDRRTRRVTPAGQVSEWRHDAASRAVRLEAGPAVEFAHDALGREVGRRVGAAVVTRAWDAQGLRGQALRGVDVPVTRRYDYRADGHLAAIGDHVGVRTFDLDERGRVVAADGPGGPERYAYDAAGNVAAGAWAGADAEVVGHRAFAGTRVRRAGHVTYAHDAAGRVVRRTRRRLSRRPETWHFRWDALDHLVGVTTPDGTRWRYRYDALGRRVSKVRLDPTGGAVEQVDFAWDGVVLAEQVTHRADTTASTTWDHDSSGLHPVAQRERVRTAGRSEIDERFYAVVTDLVGAPTELVAPDGTVAGRARRSLWGHTTWTGAASTPLLFPGQYLDTETGFAYNLHRHYDPDTARYTSPDPLGLAPSPNPVAYVHNPHTWADPLGLAPCTPVGGGHEPRFVNGRRGTVDTAAPGLREQIDRVADSVLRTGAPPPGVHQGGARAGPRGVYENRPPEPGAPTLLPRNADPQYYREADVWPRHGSRGSERVLVGRDGEVWYTPDHYGTARRIR